ncbi:MAG: hypothetical protein RBS80_06145 [Thermoguttaceae bacterium]|jgi:hypothetical protein|nr:hypothetical protein [Thermoguttaceae bacterium]
MAAAFGGGHAKGGDGALVAACSGQSLAPPARGRRGWKEERRTGITCPDGSVVARQYTARDQLSQIDYNTDMVATFAYDAGSRRTSRVLGDTPGTT